MPRIVTDRDDRDLPRGRDRTSSDLGGKGSNLARLSASGLPVPPWFCLPFEHFRDFVAPFSGDIADVMNRVGALSTAGVEALLAGLRAKLATAPLPPSLLEALHRNLLECPADSYSVRSSGSQEDSGVLSFAGLFDTYLNVPAVEVASHIKRCWISAFNLNAVLYMSQNGVSLGRWQMAVIVQKMVDASRSGVLFQANPQGKLNEIAVVASYGLGEGVVSGEVEADTIYYDRTTARTKAVIAHKSERLSFARGTGVERVQIRPESRDAPVLGEGDLRALLEMSRRLEAIFADFQDVEWAFDGDDVLWLLQSRPITTIPAGELQLYDNSNITESYPGLTSPLTFSFVRDVYRSWFYHAYRGCGFSEAVLGGMSSVFEGLVEHIDGRIYYNLTNWYRMLSILPLASSVAIPSLENAIGTERASSQRRRRDGLTYQRGKALLIFVLKFIRYRSLLQRYAADYASLHGATKREIEACQDDAQRLDALTRFMERLFPIVQFGRISDTYLMIALLGLQSLAEKRGAARPGGGAALNGLLIGEKDIESMRPVSALRALAAYGATHADARRILASAASWEGAIDQLRPDHAEFCASLEAYVELYGDRVIGELKLETLTFREAPLKLARLIADTPVRGDAAAAEQRDAAVRRESEARFLASFPRRLDRALARFLVRHLRRLVRSREFIRFNRSRYFGLVRTIVRGIAASWVERGMLADAEEIFLLTLPEVRAQVAEPNRERLEALLSARRAETERFARSRPAARMWLKGDVRQNVIPGVEAGEGGELRGVGCCPGSVTAEAAVLFAPDYGTDVAGKIIVSENTDPGWVFLLMQAAGLVMEKGSLLSHTAIIGREMGVPTVVGVRHATSSIRSGDILAIDGGSGSVEVRSHRALGAAQ